VVVRVDISVNLRNRRNRQKWTIGEIVQLNLGDRRKCPPTIGENVEDGRW
jgi:hypothetical protein